MKKKIYQESVKSRYLDSLVLLEHCTFSMKRIYPEPRLVDTRWKDVPSERKALNESLERFTH